MRDPTSQVGQYLGGLDGVRGAGALAVLTAHCIVHFAPTSTPNGIAQILAQALTVFFAMSGMLIYTPFVRDIARGERRLNVGRYVSRRLLRIFPVYLVIFVICDFGLPRGLPVQRGRGQRTGIRRRHRDDDRARSRCCSTSPCCRPSSPTTCRPASTRAGRSPPS